MAFRLGSVLGRLRDRRRVWSGGDRAWLELRAHREAEHAELLAAVVDEAEQVPGVRWARYNAPLRRLVVAFDPSVVSVDPLRRAVERGEQRAGVARRPWEPEPAEHPGDDEPIRRAAVETAADVLGLGVGATLRAFGRPSSSVDIELAAMVASMRGIPRLRDWVDSRLGSAAADLSLGLADAFSQAVVQGATGPVVDVLHRGLRIRELVARRRAWSRREPGLADRPEAHPGVAADVGERPGELPPGPIEHYAEQATFATLGGVGIGLVSTGHLAEAMLPLFAGIPKPARHGRDAFAAHLGWRLAQRDIVVMRPDALRRLDRLDTVVVDVRLFGDRQGGAELRWVDPAADLDAVQEVLERLHQPGDCVVEEEGWRVGPLHALGEAIDEASRERAEVVAGSVGEAVAVLEGERVVGLAGRIRAIDGGAERFAAAVRHHDLRLVMVADDPETVGWLDPDAVLDRRDGLLEAVRGEQTDGRGVLLVCAQADPACVAADVSVVGCRPGSLPAWQADLLAGEDIDDLRAIVDAVGVARRAARQSVLLSVSEMGTALLVSLRGLKPRTVRQVMTVANTAGLLSMANGVRLAHRFEHAPGVSIRDRTPWHAMDGDLVLARLEADRQGLSEEVAGRRRTTASERGAGRLSSVAAATLRELANPLAPVLALGAGLSVALGSVVDAAMITGVVALNGAIGGAQRLSTERALSSFYQREKHPVRVRRAGSLVEIDGERVVPGDIIELRAGEVVPADSRILEASSLEVDETSLTGESMPVSKSPRPSFASQIADRTSMLYGGTTIAAGSAVAVVVARAEQSEARDLGVATGDAPARHEGVEHRLDALTEVVVPIAAMAGLAVVVAGLVRDRSPREVVGSAVSLAVAAVPEGLPLVAAQAQLAAARRLSEQGALVRNARAVEALGRIDVLCADKTGTLTEGRLRLSGVSDGEAPCALDALGEHHRRILSVAMRASPRAPEGQEFAHVTDRAVVEGGRSVDVHAEDLGDWRPHDELPFEPARGYHAVLGDSDGGLQICVKGAPEALLGRCDRWCLRDGIRPVDGDVRAALLEHAVGLASQGLRVLAVAERSGHERRDVDPDRVRGLVFRGFVTLADPLRPAAREAIGRLGRAGVEVRMITGDHPDTARAIARQLGLDGDQPVVTGGELEGLDDEQFAERVRDARVFARITPAQKVRIVQALQGQGHVVGMTGDGANDAPAIRLADAGIALGDRSTAAAREAADVVVTDERIETIVGAILEGRALWSSVRDAVSILVGGNLGEIGFTAIGGLLGGRAPLEPRQLMLVNLLTDALPALVIAMRPPPGVDPEELLEEGPEQSLGEVLNRDIAWRATVTAGAATTAWLWARLTGGRRRASQVALLALVGTQLGQMLAVGGRSPAVWVTGVGSLAALVAAVQTPGVSRFFGGRPLGPLGLAQAATVTAAGTAVSVAAPRVLSWVERQGDGRPLGERVADSQLGRAVLESRLVARSTDHGDARPH